MQMQISERRGKFQQAQRKEGTDFSPREDVNNTLRVPVATDCHLGYLEKDEIRRFDSFEAFEDICSISEQQKVDYSGFMTINPQRFGQKYVGKVANPQDILIFSKAAKKHQSLGDRTDDPEKLRPEELNQQNIEALVAESNLKMAILPVNDLDIALHEFVNKDDKMAFYSCLRYNLEETRNKLNKEVDVKLEEEELVLKVGECMQERVQQRTLHPKEPMSITSIFQDPQGFRGKNTQGPTTSTNSFSDDEDIRQALSTQKPAGRGKKGTVSSRVPEETSKRGRGSSNLKQTTLDSALRTRHSERSASVSASTAVKSIAEDVESLSSEETEKFEDNEVVESSEPEETFQGKGRKRAAPRGRRGTTSKRGKKADLSPSNMPSIHSMFKSNDDDEDENVNRLKKATTR